MNLNEVWHYEDEVDRWAAEREFELRRWRYLFVILRRRFAPPGCR